LVQGFLDHWKLIGAGRRLFISVDGLRHNATETDRALREEVIRVVRRFEASFGDVDVIVRSRNVFGHVVLYAAQELAGEFDTFAVVEEDNRISLKGLEFLERACKGQAQPRHAAAFTSSVHLEPLPAQDRITLFPEQWGVSYNSALVEVLESVISATRIRRSVVSRAFRSVLGVGQDVEAAVDEWVYRVRGGAIYFHGDAMLQYSTWLSGRMSVVPWKSMVHDVGHLEAGGYSERPIGGSSIRAPHAPELLNGTTGAICVACERLGAQSAHAHSSRIVRYRRRLRAEAIWQIQRRNYRQSAGLPSLT
jgi:hypothetical protein